jgi:periplasmic divalent cation tolerance protein
MTTNVVELVLTCGSWQEAQRIADSLLDKKLVACVEFFEIKSKYRWHGAIEQTDEVKLLMHSLGHLFHEVEAEVKKLHSYDTFVLEALPVADISAEAKAWLTEETKGKI